MHDPPANERFLALEWAGPFHRKSSGLVDAGDDPLASPEVLSKFSGKSGLYIVVGDHPIHGASTLLYIGKCVVFDARLGTHDEWLARHSGIRVYLAVAEDATLRGDAERLLIFAHSPPYNSSNINEHNVGEPLRIWNVGSFAKLYPEVSSVYPWFRRGEKSPWYCE